MKNAFSILGATPNDNVDKLRELFEEKQLFFDDDTEINYAYTELINLKKRIKHEIRYFSKKTFKNFDNIFLKNDEEEQEIVIDDMCQAIIDVGKWFDLSSEVILDKINNSRNKSGFTPIGDAEILQGAINEFKDECIMGVKQYFDFFEEKDIVTWFNTLVKQEDYMSFFIDDLLFLYEDAMSQSIEKKEKDCTNKFDKIEQEANLFLDDDELSNNFQNIITDFKKSLGVWDKIVQPLQVNFENRGGRHESSFDFATLLRNKVIEMCNKSQKSLTKHINYNPYASFTQYNFVLKTVNSIKFIGYLENILNILEKYFIEIDDFAERLKQDKIDFSNLKSELAEILNKIDPYCTCRNKIERNEEKISQKENYTIQKQETTSDNIWEKVIKWLVGITILVAGICIIVSFVRDSTAIGVISLIIAIISAICAYKWGQLDIKLETMKIISIALAVIMGIVCIVSLAVSSSSSNSSSRSVTLTSSNFEDYFTLDSSCSLSYYTSGSKTATYNYSISPKSSFKYSNNSNNPSSITVTIGLDISSYSSSYVTPSDYKIYITLYKSNGYKTSGTKTYYNLNTNKKYWSDGIYSVSGTIYP